LNFIGNLRAHKHARGHTNIHTLTQTQGLGCFLEKSLTQDHNMLNKAYLYLLRHTKLPQPFSNKIIILLSPKNYF